MHFKHIPSFDLKNLGSDKKKKLISSHTESTQKQAPYWEKIFGRHISDKGLVSKICKQLLKFNNMKADNLTKIFSRYLSTNKDTQITHKHTKRLSIWFVIGNCKFKKKQWDTTTRYLKRLKARKLAISNANKDMEQQELSFGTSENEKWHSRSQK